ncbi:TetR/AcrR family transcriptional regulator [Peribacillus simplex]|uniref:HTH-type dhaKLM operon transcriptional activator DhaS n=1 Tax=Peribacillus simplex TaxID=1478 RepID=A0A9W4KZR8_9BACI|nr:TetR/AcrR family transcriptional regulator [Peribacillus simplex]MDR4924967.1 TetR/AcrR family transcriptional regulator [Peribacillus simplex]WHX90320.1 TetR/AcrR family transcriptional regulator [Peribacillus simplex]CAH0220176.1 HTH-type dhaKLM operon transcriptional activator DhaS [Peribacillus simplex]
MSNNNTGIDRRIRKSKLALKDSLISLMQHKDFREISITDIVERADLNRGTFYKHYQYKEELLEEVMEDVIADLILSYREPYKNVETFTINELTASVIKIFEHVANYANIYTLILKSNAWPKLLERICNELKKLPLEDLEDYRPNPKINKELASSYQAYAILGMIIEWVNTGFTYSADYMAEQLLEIINNKSVNAVFKINHTFKQE